MLQLYCLQHTSIGHNLLVLSRSQTVPHRCATICGPILRVNAPRRCQATIKLCPSFRREQRRGRICTTRIQAGNNPWGPNSTDGGANNSNRSSQTDNNSNNGRDDQGDVGANGVNKWERWEGWGDIQQDWVEDWEPWVRPEDGATENSRRKMKRRISAGRPRDEYLRPIVDFAGIRDRLSPDYIKSEERIREEFKGNQEESRSAVKFGAKLILIPLVVGFALSRLVALPLLNYAETLSPEAFAPTYSQKAEGAHEIHMVELRLRMEAAIGKTPELTPEEMLIHLRKEAQHLAHEMREHNKHAYLNLISDSISGLTFFGMLIYDRAGRNVLLTTISRVFSGLSDTAKAFVIIVFTDTLLGYHSEEGWTAAIRLITAHYGFEVENEPIYLFVAIVPVFLDSLFKLWIFNGLNKIDPAAAVTLKQMDRH